MHIDPADLKPHIFYRYLTWAITPRPIAWVSTYSPAGVLNLAPFSFFSGIGANPPSLVFSAVNKRDGSKKDTVCNIESEKEFVVNVVSFAQAEQMNLSSAEFASDESEFDKCDLRHGHGTRVNTPHVIGVPIYMECRLNQIVHLGEGPLAANLIIGDIVHMYISEDILDVDGIIDPEKLDSIGRMGGTHYTRTNEQFSLPRPTLE